MSANDAFEVVKDARKDILDRFGKYTTQTATLTRDETIADDVRKKAGQVLVVLGDPDASRALARTILETHCEESAAALDNLEEGSRSAVITFTMSKMIAQHDEQLKRVARKVVPGKHTEDAKITLRLAEKPDLYKTAVHELIHQFATRYFMPPSSINATSSKVSLITSRIRSTEAT